MSEADYYIPETIITLKNMSAYSTLFKNDLKHVHVHCIGEKFQEMHDCLQAFYEQALIEEDFFLEQAIVANEGAANPTLALSNVVSPWEPEKQEAYAYEDYLRVLLDKGTKYIDLMCGLSTDYGRVVEAKVDEFLSYWDSEVRYKLTAQGVMVLQGPDAESSVDPDGITLQGMFQENYTRKKNVI